MSGRRLLDAARLVGATRSIAKQHFAIRSQQWDVFTKTSTLARAVKGQTDRITVTARAAYALARRVNENKPSYTRGYQQPTSEHGEETSIPRQETVQETTKQPGLNQDHHYGRPAPDSGLGHVPNEDLHVAQEKSDKLPLPDGTIPPKGTLLDNDAATGGGETYNERPVTEPEKAPLADSDHATEGLHPEESTRSSIPTPKSPSLPSSQHTSRHNMEAQRQAEFQIPSISGSEENAPSAGQDTYNTRPTVTSPELSSLPRMKIPKYEEDSQGGSEHIQDGQINQDVYYSSRNQSRVSPAPAKEAVSEQDDVPEGVSTDVFHSPHVASLLRSGGRDDMRKAYEMKMKAAKRSPLAQDKSTSDPRINATTTTKPESVDEDTRNLAEEIAKDAVAPQEPASDAPVSAPYQLRESRVPSSRFGRMWQYGGLATSMAFGAVGEGLRRVTGGGNGDSGSIVMSPANIERLVAKLSRMRGAALKLGQMVSFQDSKMLPPAIHAVLQRVQDSADYMPPSQRNKVLATNLGADWKDLFTSFDDVPIAAASIGQVHRATLASTGQEVAVKIQYPGVRDSIVSDLNNLSLLLTASRLLPKGLYLDKTIANAQVELGWECDYVREAEAATRFHSLITRDESSTFRVPAIVPEACGPQILTAEFMTGTAVTKAKNLTQDERDWIGTQILRLCLRELMEWRFMQTDPNWTNFLYQRGSNNSPADRRIELLDFGASRAFPDRFVTPYIRLLIAASKLDRDACRDLSVELGYLTGAESKEMLDAHVDSILTLAEPFLASSSPSASSSSSSTGEKQGDSLYDFKDQTITDRVRKNIGLMVRERLAPPPEETYSLHRKLSGAFLLCAKLGSRVPARELFVDAVERWEKQQEKNGKGE